MFTYVVINYAKDSDHQDSIDSIWTDRLGALERYAELCFTKGDIRDNYLWDIQVWEANTFPHGENMPFSYMGYGSDMTQYKDIPPVEIEQENMNNAMWYNIRYAGQKVTDLDGFLTKLPKENDEVRTSSVSNSEAS